jgi:hypothetical protein
VEAQIVHDGCRCIKNQPFCTYHQSKAIERLEKNKKIKLVGSPKMKKGKRCPAYISAIPSALLPYSWPSDMLASDFFIIAL